MVDDDLRVNPRELLQRVKAPWRVHPIVRTVTWQAGEGGELPTRKVGPHSYIVCAALLLFLGALGVWSHRSAWGMVVPAALVLIGVGVLLRLGAAFVLAFLASLAGALLGAFWFLMEKGLCRTVAWECVILIIGSTFGLGVVLFCDTGDFPWVGHTRGMGLGWRLRAQLRVGRFLAVCLAAFFVVWLGHYLLTLPDRIAINRKMRALIECARAGAPLPTDYFRHPRSDEFGKLSTMLPRILSSFGSRRPAAPLHNVAISWFLCRAKVQLRWYLYHTEEVDVFVHFERSWDDPVWRVTAVEEEPVPSWAWEGHRVGFEGRPTLRWATDPWW